MSIFTVDTQDFSPALIFFIFYIIHKIFKS